MPTLRSSRLVAVLLLITLWPALGLAQSAPPAGVVTGLQGTARLVRPVIAQPIQLKFKDDLFLRDQVETRENSVVRVLLGGKALVTIRELSTFTITEEPGRAAIDLKSGKIAVGVAKSLLKPGEAIEIRTPNAIAAVRGSLLIASVVISGGVPQSSFTALDASLPITVTPLGGSAAAVALNANQAVGVSGIGGSTAMGPVQNITPEVARREAQTAAAPRAADGQGSSSPMAAQISVAKAQEAAMLASLLAPAPTGGTPPPTDATLASATQVQLLQEPGSGLTTTAQAVAPSIPPPPSTAALGVNATAAAGATTENSPPGGTPSGGGTPPGEETPPGGGGVIGGGGGTPPGGSPVVISGQNVTLTANQTLKTYVGPSISLNPAAEVTITNSTVTGADNLIVVEPGANASLAGPLLDVTDSTITTNNRLLFLDGSTLTSSTTSPFLFFDPSTVTSGGQMLLLLNDANLSLAGPLVAAQSTAFTAGNPALTAASLLTIVDGSTLTSTSTAPLISFDASSFDGGTLVSVRRSPSTLNRSTLTLAGPLFSAVNESMVNTSSLGLGATVGTAGGPCCSLVSITQGGQLSSTTTNPLIQASGSLLSNGPDAQSGGSIVNIADTATGLPAGELVAPSSMSLAGPLLRSDSSTLTGLFHLLRVGNSSLVSTTTDPLIQLNNSTVNLGGFDPFANATSVARLLNLSGSAASPGTLVLQGPLVSAVNSNLTSTGSMFGIFDGATLTSSTPNALISISGGSALAAVSGPGNNFISIASSLGLPPTVSLAGPLLAAANTVLRNGDPANNIFSFLFVGDSSNVSSSGTAAFLAFDNANVDSAAGILSLRRSLSTATPTKLTLAGPLFSAVNGSVFNTTSLGLGSACCNAFSMSQAAELTSTTTAPLIQLSGSTFNVGPDAQSGANFFGVADNSIDGPVTAPAKVSLAGPLLHSTAGSSISALFHLLSIARSNFSSTSTEPLIQLHNSTANLGGLDPFTNATSGGRVLTLSGTAATPGTLTLQGPLFSAVGSHVIMTSEMFGVFAGGSLAQTGSVDPLIILSGGTVLDSGGHFVHAQGFATGGSIPASLTLSGPLLAMNETVMNVSGNLLRLADGGSLSSTTGDPLVSLTGGTFNGPPAGSVQGGSLLRMFSQVGQSGTSLTLSGPYLAFNGTAYNAMDTTAFNIADGAAISSTSTQPFALMSGGSVAVGGNVVGLAAQTSFTTPGQPTTVGSGVPPAMNLAGPLLSATGTTISSPFNLLSIFRGGMASGTADPLIQFSGLSTSLGGVNPIGGAPTFGRVLVLQASGATGTADSPTSLSLTGAGPLLLASNSNISTTSDVIGIFNGATLTSASTAPLVQVNGGTVATQVTGGFGGYFLQTAGTGGPTGSGFASAQLGGALLDTSGSLSLSGGLVGVFAGGQVTSTGSTDPFALLNGGTHVIAGNPAPGVAMFSLSGRSTAVALDAESQLSLGTDRPIQGALQLNGTRPMLTSLLETSGATVTGEKVFRMDNALLEATAPLLNLRANGATQSLLTTTGANALDLTFQARVSALGSSLIRLDNSVLNVMNGSLVNVNASKLTVGGDLVSLLNGATLSLFNGPLLTVSGSGFVSIAGGLIGFGGTGGNTVNVTNSLCPCTLFGGVPVALQNGALASNILISNPIKNPALGNLNLSPNAALAVVNGAGSKLIVGPQ